MIRFNPWALALAFGVAKVVMMIASFAPLMMQRSLLRGLPSGMDTFGYGFILTNVVWNFVGGVIAGGLFALIYNKIADRSVARSVQP